MRHISIIYNKTKCLMYYQHFMTENGPFIKYHPFQEMFYLLAS